MMDYLILIGGTIVTFLVTYISYSKNRDENEKKNLSNKYDNIFEILSIIVRITFIFKEP